ncbi:PREDICTED: uncharacterized protein LOC109178447 [Ipomoea nil]|uniref:uncharacterized protein LOC109178447 n=1 Tax=Ipomoea nil TaxID=35883 RepID=UPI000900977B|nr:PREDICTED: uncharacterized protein LOC109178447 [Ipomoea nil]
MIAQLVKLVTKRPSGSLPSTTENNPKERVNDISICQESESDMVVMETQRTMQGHKGKEVMRSDVKTDTKNTAKTVTSRYRPQALKQMVNMAKLEQQGKFNALLRKLYVIMPLINTLKNLPRSTCKKKEHVLQKKEIHEESHAHLSVACSDVLEKGCHKKDGDPGVFVVPCAINDTFIGDAPADLGASVNVMPSCVSEKLNVPLTPTRMTIQLADGPELKNVPLIFGRPFLAAQQAVIDVSVDNLTLRLNDEETKFGKDVRKGSNKMVLPNNEGEEVEVTLKR